jgi:hypothetical protein
MISGENIDFLLGFTKLLDVLRKDGDDWLLILGWDEGCELGCAVGWDEGEDDGLLVGCELGWEDGWEDGEGDGLLDGCELGRRDGLYDGEDDGLLVGCELGSGVGLGLGRRVGCLFFHFCHWCHLFKFRLPFWLFTDHPSSLSSLLLFS